jgi:cytochrome c553
MRRSFVIGFSVVGLIWLFAAFEADAGPLDSPGAQKALVCTACHGSNGNSPGNTMPILAGMTPSYFKKAIKDYAEGKRPSPEMEPYSKYVMQAGLDEIAAYFAEQKRQLPRTRADAKAAGRGKAIAENCTACHGRKGEGVAKGGFSAIQGQPAAYLQAQLMLLKEDKRKLDDVALDEVKKDLLKSLGDRDIADVAAYYSNLK